MYIYIYTCVYIYIYIYTQIHTHTASFGVAASTHKYTPILTQPHLYMIMYMTYRCIDM